MKPYKTVTSLSLHSDISGDYSVMFGEHDRYGTSPVEFERPVKMSDIFVHESYDPATEANDIALMWVESVGEYSEFVRPICLPDVAVDYTGMKCVVSGWGVIGECEYFLYQMNKES